jgi:opacity protein-like surface antigen
MKKFLLATTALCFGSGATMAADLVVVPTGTPAVNSSWAGFYLGAHGGYGWGNNDFSVVLGTNPLFAVGGIKSRGALYGGQAGYNWQYGRGVAGVELDFSTAGINGSTASSSVQGTLTDFDSRSDEIKYLGTARARLGWLPTDNVLLYGTAGLGWERVDRVETRN